MRRLYLIDLSVLAHKANAARLETPVPRKRGFLSAWFRANIAHICGLSWDTERHHLDRPVVAFLLDSKPYWRAGELKKVGIAYKKGRKSRSRKGLSYAKSLLIKEALTAGLPVLGLPGQEADDMASLLVRRKPDDVAVRLVTTDNDWCGLIDPATSVDWYCMHGYYPRHRATLAHVQASSQGKKAKIQNLEDFYRLKQQIGDAGDNIPPNAPAWATDILNPLEAHDPALHESGISLAKGFYEAFDRYTKVTQSRGLYSDRAEQWLVSQQAAKLIH